MLMVCRYRLALLAAFVLAFYADCSSQTGLAKPSLLKSSGRIKRPLVSLIFYQQLQQY